jgi:hypothetical protein
MYVHALEWWAPDQMSTGYCRLHETWLHSITYMRTYTFVLASIMHVSFLPTQSLMYAPRMHAYVSSRKHAYISYRLACVRVYMYACFDSCTHRFMY